MLNEIEEEILKILKKKMTTPETLPCLEEIIRNSNQRQQKFSWAAKDQNGNRIIDYAREHCDHHIVDFLKRHGTELERNNSLLSSIPSATTFWERALYESPTLPITPEQYLSTPTDETIEESSSFEDLPHSDESFEIFNWFDQPDNATTLQSKSEKSEPPSNQSEEQFSFITAYQLDEEYNDTNWSAKTP